MNADRHARVKAIFLEACALSGDKRATFLNHTCANDADLRGEVERLLSHHASGGDAAKRPTSPEESTLLSEDPSDLLESPHFSTGHLIADRYRIVTLLGEGGMGRVYRAEDLRLNLTVALKFMPRLAALDPAWRRRVEREVKLSRAVSHSNVCRVFDLGEVDGIPFISMEFVEGEDLAALRQRIGRLTGDRAIAIARQICAGLAASHAQGVLHRDLKPSNIMLDGKGNVRITDFGLAVVAGRIDKSELPAGTPRYMAPELFTGAPASEQSDIYALGLVLYEMFTGQPAFTGKGAAEYAHLQRSEEPPTPSSVAPEIDLKVEAVILACLQKDPVLRPASVLHVAAALPGGDLLAAALAAGQIPTREMLAAAAATGTISRSAMLRVAGAALVLLIAAIAIGIGTHPIAKNGGAKSPEVLKEQARRIAITAGLIEPPLDADIRFLSATEVEISHAVAGNYGLGGILGSTRDALFFCYRETRTAPLPSEVDVLLFIMPGAEPFQFVPTATGVTTIVLDAAGRLVLFDSNETTRLDSTEPKAASDWDAFIEASGRNPKNLKRTESIFAPRLGADNTLAYVSSPDDDSHVPARIEIATSQNQLRFFGVFSEAPSATTPPYATSADRWTVIKTTRNTVFLILLIAGLPAAWRSWRNRGDLVGAVRVGGFVFILRLVGSLFVIKRIGATPEIIDTLARTLVSALAEATIVALFYFAFERHVRQLWPRTLGCWSRLLTGVLRDPFVGRDVLIGCMVGCFWAILIFVDRLLPPWLGWEVRSQLRLDQSVNHLLGPRFALAGAIDSVRGGIYQGMVMLFLLVLATWMAGRRKWLALVIAWFIGSLMFAPAATHPITAWTIYAFGGIALGVYLLQHWGLLSLLTALFIVELICVFPITADLNAWYAGYGLFGVAMALGLIIWGLHQSRRSVVSIPAPSGRS